MEQYILSLSYLIWEPYIWTMFAILVVCRRVADERRVQPVRAEAFEDIFVCS